MFPYVEYYCMDYARPQAAEAGVSIHSQQEKKTGDAK